MSALSVTELPPVEKMEVRPYEGRLRVEWKHPNRTVSEYIVEWVSDDEMDWQRENGTTNSTEIKGTYFLLLD